MKSTGKQVLVKTKGEYQSRTLYKKDNKNYARLSGSFTRLTRRYLAGAGPYYRPYRSTDKLRSYRKGK